MLRPVLRDGTLVRTPVGRRERMGMDGLSGKVAIVTGGAAGIGRATAEALSTAGATVVLADVRDDAGQAVAATLSEQGHGAMYVHADVVADEQVAALVAQAVERFGGLDLAFNNAGVEGTMAPTHLYSPDAWARTLAVNLTGVWSCMRHEIPAMLARGGGSIVNCSSAAGLVGFPGAAAYVASKHGVIGLTKAAALDYATSGIRVNAVCPGVVDTDMVQRLMEGDDAVRTALMASEPVGRLGRPEEIADAVLCLLSDRMSFMTGQAVAVDGGFVAR
jgi:NAD(P)-dependent dehydrogenase (short-subunit alcohol dehydrogenase family)